MTTRSFDHRSPARRARDEEIAAEPKLAPVELTPNAPSSPVETYLSRRHRPLAITGVVENGLVRPLDPEVKLAEHSRVIIVASEEA